MPPIASTRFVLPLVLLAACDGSFLHGVPAIDAPNDATCGGATAPSSVAVTTLPDGAALTWQASLPGDFSIIVQRRSADGVWGETGRVPPTSVSYLDTNCTAPNSKCDYRLVAASASCQTLPSAEVSAVTVPEAVRDFIAQGQGENARLTWSANNLYVTGYRLERVPAGSSTTTEELAATATAFDDALLLGNTYCYRLSAITDGGIGPAVESCTRAGAASFAPLLSPRVNAVQVGWFTSQSYPVPISVRRNGVEVTVLPEGSPAYLDTGLVQGETYTYELIGLSANGDSEPISATGTPLDTTITETAVSVFTTCFTRVTINLSTAAGMLQHTIDGFIEHASSAQFFGGNGVYNFEGAIDDTASVGAYDVYVSVDVASGGTYDAAFTNRLRFANLTSSVMAPDGAPYTREGTQPWAGNAAPTCNGDFGPIASIDAGVTNTTCVRTTMGRIACWGGNLHGQLGTAVSTQQSSVPRGICRINGGVGCNGQFLLGMKQVALAGTEVYAVADDGQLWSWGNSVINATDVTLPTPFDGVRPTSIVGGIAFACATVDGSVSCWGEGSLGQLGHGASPVSSGPQRVCTGTPCVEVTGLTTVAAGGSHACAAGANVYCWGYNGDGQCGTANTTLSLDRATPVAGVTNVIQLAAGEDFTCALRSDRTVRCWGRTGVGALGNGVDTEGYSATPVVVQNIGGGGTLGNVVAIAAGAFHACALQDDGTVACWGANEAGQLGNDTRTRSSVPRRVLTAPSTPLTRVGALTAGQAHTCAVLADADVACWGSNASGQLGNGTTAPDSPVAVRVMCDGNDATCGVRAEPMYRAGVRGRGSLEAVLQ